jgi:hypothetical protein
MSDRRPISPPSSSRNHSIPFTPATPSSLRESHTVADSQEDIGTVEDRASSSSAHPSPNTYPAEFDADPGAEDVALDGKSHGISDVKGKIVDETTALLRKPLEFILSAPHAGNCDHGTFSPRVESRAGSIRSGGFGFGGTPEARPGSGEGSQTRFGSFLETLGMRNGSSGGKKKMSTTSYLAERHGIKNTTSMYFTYYIPFLAWTRQYRWRHLQGDLIAAITMASFYIPMALSLASNLAHVPPINGLYSFVFNPIIYAILGSCPQMVWIYSLCPFLYFIQTLALVSCTLASG